VLVLTGLIFGLDFFFGKAVIWLLKT
jgi:hypothetical protein